MARSLKKGPFVYFKLQRKVDELNKSGKKKVVNLHGSNDAVQN